MSLQGTLQEETQSNQTLQTDFKLILAVKQCIKFVYYSIWLKVFLTCSVHSNWKCM